MRRVFVSVWLAVITTAVMALALFGILSIVDYSNHTPSGGLQEQPLIVFHKQTSDGRMTYVITVDGNYRNMGVACSRYILDTARWGMAAGTDSPQYALAFERAWSLCPDRVRSKYSEIDPAQLFEFEGAGAR